MFLRRVKIYGYSSFPPSTIFNRKDSNIILIFEYCKHYLSFCSSTLARNLCESESLKANEVFKLCVTHVEHGFSACSTSCTSFSKLEYVDTVLFWMYGWFVWKRYWGFLNCTCLQLYAHSFFFWSPHPYFSCINVNLNNTSQLSEIWNQSQSFSICICPTLETVFQWTWLLFYSDTGFLRVGYLKIYQILRKTKTMKCWNRAVGGEFGPRNRFYSMVSVIDVSRSKSCL